ncbi:FR47-like protein [Saxophila tyrrhenica]|uniref:FR47-like protein n=1 Tax=Saxophila tyrrhenica TaxID=1690608 RepID=A0AAV9PRE2_9PEZI|nr:FR47-like protein [Saxophila tyrrhenica]
MASLPDPEQPTITAASREDVPEIYAMIKELATYENALDKVEATEVSLRRTLSFEGSHGHTNPGYAKALLLRLPVKPPNSADTPEAVAGFALYFTNFSTWRSKPGIYLEDLFVRSQYRKRGYGRMLIQALAREVLMMDGGRLEWSCLRSNTPSLEFYRSLGAKEMEDWVQLRVDGSRLEKLALGKTEAIQTGRRDERTGQVLQFNRTGEGNDDMPRILGS